MVLSHPEMTARRCIVQYLQIVWNNFTNYGGGDFDVSRVFIRGKMSRIVLAARDRRERQLHC